MRALITGASSGIGKEIAKELDRKGIDLVLVARNYEKLEEVKKGLKGNCKIICMDLEKEENCKQLYEEVGEIDILINNAGFGCFGEFWETNLEKEISMIHTNITAYHILTKLYLQDMIAKNHGHILNVASIAGFMPGPLMSAYYASKAYIVRLSEGISEELKKKKSDVKISILCPGPVSTNFNKVAGVKFHIPSCTAEYVAKYAIKKMMQNKFLLVPSVKIKLARILSKISPDSITAKVTYHMQKRKR